jgi:hypothetical protein
MLLLISAKASLFDIERERKEGRKEGRKGGGGKKARAFETTRQPPTMNGSGYFLERQKKIL